MIGSVLVQAVCLGGGMALLVCGAARRSSDAGAGAGDEFDPASLKPFTDGVPPAPKAQAIFVAKYWDYLSNDTVARPWFLKP